jgi:hypothetical protein
MCEFGIALNNYLVLTAAAQEGAQTLALTRGTAGSPYTTALAAINYAAGTLNTAKVSPSMTVNGVACTASSCAVSTAGQIALVTLTYPCDLTVMGINLGGTACVLSTQSAAAVQ